MEEDEIKGTGPTDDDVEPKDDELEDELGDDLDVDPDLLDGSIEE